MTIPGKPPAPTNLVHHIGIAVSDLDASIDFYQSIFGLEPGPKKKMQNTTLQKMSKALLRGVFEKLNQSFLGCN